MDELDKKILYEISENANDSRNKIAKKIRCSREVLDYRIKKLQDQKIITGYQARINISNFIYGGYVLLIQSYGLNSESERKIISKLKLDNKLHYIGKITGEYDFIIGFTVNNLKEVSTYLEFINKTFGKCKNKMTLLTMLEEQKDSFKSLFKEKDEPNGIISMLNLGEKINLDKIDKKILIDLGKNCLIPSWSIAEKVKLSDVAIRKRIDKLVENKVILDFRTMIDLTKLNYQSYFLLLKINSKGNEFEQKFVSFLKTSRKVTYATKFIGEYDYVVDISIENNTELKEFIYYLRENFSDLIMEIVSCPLFEIISHEYITEDFLN